MKYNEKIVALRKANGFTQEAFAREVGVTRQAVYKWEIGDSYPEAEKLIAIKKLFGISIDDLLDDSFDVIVEKPKKPARKKTLPPVAPAIPVAAPVVEEPAAPVAAPAAQEPAAPMAAPVVEEPAAPVAAPAVEESAAPVATPVVEEPAAPVAAPAVEEPAAPVAAPAVEAPAAPAAAPVVEAPAAPAAAPAPAAVAAPAADEDDEFDFEVTETPRVATQGSLTDLFIKKK